MSGSKTKNKFLLFNLLITDAATGPSTWYTFASTFTSKNLTNVMPLQEDCGSVHKTSSQSMGEWISCVKSLVSQLRGVGIVLEDPKIANRILNGLGKEDEFMRHALQAALSLSL